MRADGTPEPGELEALQARIDGLRIRYARPASGNRDENLAAPRPTRDVDQSQEQLFQPVAERSVISPTGTGPGRFVSEERRIQYLKQGSTD